MTDANRVWTHISEDQAAGRACVMCGRPTDEPGWRGRGVGRSETGGTVYACSGGGTQSPGASPWSTPRPPAGRDCAEQAETVVPDSLEGLDL